MSLHNVDPSPTLQNCVDSISFSVGWTHASGLQSSAQNQYTTNLCPEIIRLKIWVLTCPTQFVLKVKMTSFHQNLYYMLKQQINCTNKQHQFLFTIFSRNHTATIYKQHTRLKHHRKYNFSLIWTWSCPKLYESRQFADCISFGVSPVRNGY